MATATRDHTIEGYLGDLIAVSKHVGEIVARHAKDERAHRVAEAGTVLEKATEVLKRHHADLEAYARSIGGTGAMGALKEGVTSVTGFVTGVYGTLRGEAVSRMLRDDSTGIGFVLTCTQMLHTTGLALGDVTITTKLREHMEELAQLVMEIGHVLPRAVVADLGANGVAIENPRAGDEAARMHENAWKAAGEAVKTCPSGT